MSSRRKILFVSSNFPPVIGGSSVVYDQICRNLSDDIVALGPSRDYRTGKEWSDLAAVDLACGYPVHRIAYLRPPAGGQSQGWFGRFSSLIGSDLPVMLRALVCIVGLILRYRIKAVCLGELVSGGWMVFPLRYLLGRRVLIYTHGEEISQNTDGALGRMRRTCLKHAHGIISVSLFCKGQIVSKFGIDPSHIHVVNNGVNLETFGLGRRDRSCLPAETRDHRVILSVGRLVERKGHEMLISALPRILERVPDAHCVVVGDGPLAEQIKAKAAALGLMASCTFLGSVGMDRLIQLYRSCDLFALPCRTLPDGDTEGFGLVFLEANACGLPVVAGAAGGTVEAVVDGETGLLVDGNDPAAIADAVVRVLGDAPFAARLASVGWQRAQLYSWQNASQRFLEFCLRKQERSADYCYLPTVPANFAGSEAGTLQTNDVPRFLMTIDVEEEFVWTEYSRDRHVVRGADALAEFHEGFHALGIKPVYLLSYPVLLDKNFRRLFRTILADGAGELGVHLHSWTTPPFWEEPNVFSSYQCNLPEHIERRKLERLAREFEDCFGQPVLIHRAGRWGGSEQTSALLEQLAIPVDLSPSVGYSDPSIGGPDCTNLDGRPFWSGPRKTVLTIPASAINNLRGPQWVSNAFFAALDRSSTLRSLDNVLKVGKPVRFSPEGNPAEMLVSMAQELKRRALPVCVFTLHSSSLYVGGNPYSQNESVVNDIKTSALRVVNQCLNARLLRASSCAEIYAEAKRESNSCYASVN